MSARKRNATRTPQQIVELARRVGRDLFAYADVVIMARAKKRPWLSAVRLAFRHACSTYAALDPNTVPPSVRDGEAA